MLLNIFTKYFFIIIRWIATRKGIIITCLAILLDTVYAFCIFFYYILSNISLSQRLKLYIHVQNVYEYVLNKLLNKFVLLLFVQCWTNVEGVGPTLYKCYTNVLCLLGDQ